MSQKLRQAEQRVARKRAEIEKTRNQLQHLQEKLGRLQEEEKLLEAEQVTALFIEYGVTFEEAKTILAHNKARGGSGHVSSTESSDL
ncbi:MULTISPECIES: hypothetical protein [unclassified Streptococcus]|uniref:hypothetical protein n=1 Tax=unclassified Streptococcus TaxID=2608887 RepID=UPI001072993B|nr:MULTISPECIES: hypothetical protein [unclassified Streptococcus]MBF0787154.1 hypothetical protein [Streptococcus sp. 19428wC2_LYSM12]MCQ9212130.1 hypothetical protein [Streptococcus sp. B01]MCQ9213459.1 hypothetical protein [Streptococcus sp. O1]TFV05907.1 hypothetical protein E4T79_04490 [Streptococcus sp. LYSM12]